jgi:UDP-N-acetylmuramoylalanine--D-glutamate ligase
LGEGAEVTLTDDAATVSHDVTETAGLRVIAGGIDAQTLLQAELLVLSPGVPRAHPAVAAALAAGVPCANEIEVAVASMLRAGHTPNIWAVTGTNGKSTTTTLAGAILQQRDAHAFAGGNLGTPLCSVVLGDRAAWPTWMVLELSSYQLETITHLPVLASTVTNLSPDHLDRYPNVDAYYRAKANLFALGGSVSLNVSDALSMSTFHQLSTLPGQAMERFDFDVRAGALGVHIDGDALFVNGSPAVRLSTTNPRILGHHNRQNAAAAVALAHLSSFSKSEMQQGLDAYAGIAHRLERVGTTARKLTFWNDSKATNVDATLTALRSFANQHDAVLLILGGKGKGAPYAPLVDAARAAHVMRVFTIGDDAPAIENAFSASGIDAERAVTLDVACARAHALSVTAQPMHLVLSPACASFDQFRDYAHRGAAFASQFALLKDTP